MIEATTKKKQTMRCRHVARWVRNVCVPRERQRDIRHPCCWFINEFLECEVVNLPILCLHSGVSEEVKMCCKKVLSAVETGWSGAIMQQTASSSIKIMKV